MALMPSPIIDFIMKHTYPFILSLSIFIVAGLTGCSGNSSTKNTDSASSETGDTKFLSGGGPKVGEPAMGGEERPKPDAALQTLINETLPKFKQTVWKNAAGDTLAYNICLPADLKKDTKYPLVLFMADASTPGTDITMPLTQGYGGLVWATDEFQKKNPCFVIVPQYPYIEVDNQWQTGKQVDMTIDLIKELCKKYPVDTNRLYTTGQSMGGMMSMYFNVKYKGFFAASLYVACEWDISKLKDFKDDRFVYIAAEGDPGGHGGQEALMNLFKKENAPFGYAMWSARLPEKEQDARALELLKKGYSCNFITFEGNTVLPAGTNMKDLPPAADHMASFNYAYRLAPVRNWLFQQRK